MPTFAPNVERPSFWTVLPGGIHETIATALQSDAVVVNAVNAKLAHPNDMNARDHVLDVITRQTGACLGEMIAKRTLDPENEMVTLFRALPSGTAAAIATAIGGSAETHDAFASGDISQIVHTISRETGRCLFQAFTGQIGAGSLNLDDLAQQLLHLAGL